MGNASLSYMYFWYFDLQVIWIWYYRDIHNITKLGHQISLAKHASNKCDINMRVWGNEEEGIREGGDREVLNCMSLQITTKKLHSTPNESSELTLHQPTWKGIQLPRNWFTSRVSVHSLCNGQEKALQKYKIPINKWSKYIWITHEIILLNSWGLLRSNFHSWASS